MEFLATQPTATQAKRARSDEAEAGREREDEQRGNDASQEMDELYGTLRSEVVGVQYYRGMVGRGEYVMLRREPTNQYDRNAIQVVNFSGVQVGHIPRVVASKLADFIDSGMLSVDGQMIGQNLDLAKHYQLAITISFYTKPSLSATVEPMLSQAFGSALQRNQPVAPILPPTQVTNTQGSQRSAASRPDPVAADQELKRIMAGFQQVADGNQQADGVMDSLTKDIDVMNIPLHPNPPGIANGDLHVDLLPHQSQALQWMIEHENPKLPTKPSDPAVQFWVKQAAQGPRGKDHWLNVATRTPQAEDPILGKGGIIADGMGLGKTLTALALALATKSDPATAGESKCTLIVCPLSVLGNWQKQIKDHVVEGKLSSYTYHADTKGVSAAKLSKYDIVITTYQTLATDVMGSRAGPASQVASQDWEPTQKGKGKKQKTASGILAGINWKRVVADEGHVLKNPKSQMAQAFAALKAGRRWVCTGTPIVNSPADLGSLLTCIQVCKPLDRADYYKSLLLRPLRANDPTAAKLLQAVVAQVLLRRTKTSVDANGDNLVKLPPLTYFKCSIQLDEVTRALYDEISAASRSKFLNLLETGEGRGNVLAMITRLRQLCLSSDLVPQSFLDEMRRPTVPADDNGDGKPVPANLISAEQREELLKKLKVALLDNEECAICSDTMTKEEARIPDCGHPGCLSCLSAWLVKASTCPICRHSITSSSLLALPADESEYVEPDVVSPIQSAKINEIIRFLKVFPSTDKTLVFSQFTSFLGHVKAALDAEGISCCRFDGSMPTKKRQQVIDMFQRPVVEGDESYNPKVMLISLKSGAVGLNLTAANRVFLCDPWWQSAIESQAIDRAHRMPQEKAVTVYQLIAEDTIESKVLDIQKKKDELVATAFEKTTKESGQAKRDAKFDDLKALFGVQ